MPVGADFYDSVADAMAAWVEATATEVALYDVTGAELAATGGYARQPVPSWPAAADGYTRTTVDFGTSSAAWPENAVSWAALDALGAIVYSDRLPEEAAVDAESVDVSVLLDVFYKPVR